MKFKEFFLLTCLAILLVACKIFTGKPPLTLNHTATVAPLSMPPTRIIYKPSLTPAPPVTATAQPPEENELAAWTLLVYMDADNNLESYGVADLNEMADGVKGLVGMQLVVQIDRAAGYFAGEDDWTEARRYALVDGELSQVAALGEINMGDGATLSQFLAWGLRQYPAEHYALIMWGHGVGWQGITYDISADAARINALELGEAIGDGLVAADIPKLDLIGFDACLMAQLDVFTAVKDVADFSVASQELIPAQGWDYAQLLANLRLPPADSDGRWLAETIVDTYAQTYADSDTANTTLSAIDTAALDPLNLAVEQLATILQSDAEVYATAISNARGGGVTFASMFPSQQAQYGSIDLGRFASLIAQLSPNAAGREAAEAVLAQLEQVVVRSVRGAGLPLASGVATYFPRTNQFYDPAYAQVTTSPAWDAVLQAYYALPLPVPQIELTTRDFDIAISDLNPALLRFFVAGRLIEEVSFWAGNEMEDGRIKLYEFERLLPEPIELPDGTQLQKWRDGVHDDFFIWDAQATVLFDATEAQFVVMWPVAGSATRFAVQGD
ncbi:MAG TPA: hypothetical protein ENJ56_04650, partial [Anaerolineae bacterium]|nr:hypothetical protein [Anaerolineae bacterium]